MILVTGANGFVGRFLVQRFSEKKILVKALVRKKIDLFDNNPWINQVVCEDIFDKKNDWDLILSDVDKVIHLIAKTHDFNECSQTIYNSYRQTNVLITEKLLDELISRKIRRFVYISSVKVNGEFTMPGKMFSPDNDSNPTTTYGKTKLEAENLVIQRCSESIYTDYVIIRCPLIYGSSAKGNFASLIKLHKFGLPIPATGLNLNKRSFVGIKNLLDFIELCAFHPEARNEKFMVSDNQDVSSYELIFKIGCALNAKTRYFYLPQIIIRPIVIFFVGKTGCERLYSNLQVDITKNFIKLGWKPKYSLDENLKQIFNLNNYPKN